MSLQSEVKCKSVIACLILCTVHDGREQTPNTELYTPYLHTPLPQRGGSNVMKGLSIFATEQVVILWSEFYLHDGV